MLFFSKDLLNELQRQRDRTERVQRALIDEVHYLIQQGEKVDTALLSRMLTPGTPAVLPGANPDFIFTRDVIREICVRYRLRFLPLQYYKPSLPYEALLQVRRLEEQHSEQLQNFYIMAPAEAFRLERKTDPLLFASLADGTFLLVHRWGNDLSWYRKAWAFPLRNFSTFAATSAVISFLIAVLLPASWIALFDHGAHMSYSIRMYVFFMLVLASLFSALFLHVRKNKNLSEDEWESKYL